MAARHFQIGRCQDRYRNLFPVSIIITVLLRMKKVKRATHLMELKNNETKARKRNCIFISCPLLNVCTALNWETHAEGVSVILGHLCPGWRSYCTPILPDQFRTNDPVVLRFRDRYHGPCRYLLINPSTSRLQQRCCTYLSPPLGAFLTRALPKGAIEENTLHTKALVEAAVVTRGSLKNFLNSERTPLMSCTRK